MIAATAQSRCALNCLRQEALVTCFCLPFHIMGDDSYTSTSSQAREESMETPSHRVLTYLQGSICHLSIILRSQQDNFRWIVLTE